MSINLILGLIFLVLAIGAALLKKTYFELPLRELRKRSAFGEDWPKDIIKTLSYGSALRFLLWLILGLSLAASLTFLSRALPIWLSVIAICLLLFYLFSYIPSTKVSGLDKQLTRLCSPGLNWLLSRSSKYLNRVHAPFTKGYKEPSDKVFDNQDLLDFLKNLSRRNDQRIEPEVFLVLERSLGFSEVRVGDLMTPSKRVKTMLESDVIGPILINDLHESNEGYALVRAEPKGDITGLISRGDLNIRSQGIVGTHMRKDIYFINQNDQASSIIKAFYDTKIQIFVVVNDNKKFVGTISLETVIKQLTGPLNNVGSEENVEAVAKTDD